MSEPKTDYSNPAYGALHELISAMSALNMEPEPIKEPREGAFYLSETDAMAAHSMEHMHAAYTLIGRCQQLFASIALLHNFATDDFLSDKFTFEDADNFLKQLTKIAREHLKETGNPLLGDTPKPPQIEI